MIGNRFMLLSDSTFFSFNCATGGTLTPVKAVGGKSCFEYIPICGKVVYL